MTTAEYRNLRDRELPRRARALREIRNGGGGVIPRRAVVTILRKYGGLEIRWRPRGGRLSKNYRGCRITRVEPQALELLP